MSFVCDGDEYEHVEGWAGLDADESFRDVCRIGIGDDDVVHVLNRSDHPGMTFAPDGERIATWGTSFFSDRPHGMALDHEGRIYCTDDGDHTVGRFSSTGELEVTYGEPGDASDTGFRLHGDIFERLTTIDRAAGPFNGPTGVAVADDSSFFVADGYGNACVHAFDAEGNHRESWGSPGPRQGEFRLPHSAHFGPEERLWVTDRENSRIQLFDRDGTFLEEWIDVIRPTDVSFAGDRVYVSELCNRLSIFDLAGNALARWGNFQLPTDEPLFHAPHGVAVDSRGDIYVGEVALTSVGVDLGPNSLHKFVRQ